MSIDQLPIGPNPGQQNMDRASNTINEDVKESMGVLQDTGPEGRSFLDGEHNLFGYNGVVVREGKIVSLVNLDPEQDIPPINLDSEVVIEGNSVGYVSSGHKPGDKVRVISLIEPFYKSKNDLISSDKIIQVDGAGVIGWIKPSEINRQLLSEEREKKMKELFDPSS